MIARISASIPTKDAEKSVRRKCETFCFPARWTRDTSPDQSHYEKLLSGFPGSHSSARLRAYPQFHLLSISPTPTLDSSIYIDWCLCFSFTLCVHAVYALASPITASPAALTISLPWEAAWLVAADSSCLPCRISWAAYSHRTALSDG